MNVLPLPSQERLKEALDYNPETGVFRWKKPSGKKMKPGDIAGNNEVYKHIKIDGVNYKAHRLAWMYMTGEDPLETKIDHDDRNPSNIRFSNLRKASDSENVFNSPVRSNNQLGIKGVYKKGNRYSAQITINYKSIRLGYFDTPEEAYRAYCDAADEYHGEFAYYEEVSQDVFDEIKKNNPIINGNYTQKKSSRNTSGYKGVQFRCKNGKPLKNPWYAVVQYNGKKYGCGFHPTAELARDAYLKKAQELFGIT